MHGQKNVKNVCHYIITRFGLNHRISFFLSKRLWCVAGGWIVNTLQQATITFCGNFDSFELILVVLLQLRLYPLR